MNCTPYWELPDNKQETIDAILVVNNADGANLVWGENGDRPNCPAKCRKCGQNRLRFNENNEHWCRRCKYTFYNEYFEPK